MKQKEEENVKIVTGVQSFHPSLDINSWVIAEVSFGDKQLLIVSDGLVITGQHRCSKGGIEVHEEAAVYPIYKSGVRQEMTG